MDDLELLREYAASQSEQAFATLVGRHVDLVYSAALRQVRDPDLAEEVTQTVFIRLARKAGSIRVGVILSGWLFRTTRFVASEVVRLENRRRHREQEAMESLYESQGEAPWAQIAPSLDEAMAGLNTADRDALLLRFLERKNLKEVGHALGTNEDAAQKRITRALEKLRSFFERRGKVISASVLAGALSTSAVQAVPTGLAASVTAAVMLSGAAAGSTLTIGALKFMAWTNLKSAVAVGVCVVTGATALIIESRQVSNLRAENQRLALAIGDLQKSRANEMARLPGENDELERLKREAAEVHKLRGEVAALRRERADTAKVADENAHRRQPLKTDEPQTEPDTPDLSAEEEAEGQINIAKGNYLKKWGLAFNSFAAEHEGRMPKDFSQLQQYLPANLESAPGQFEVVYQGTLKELKNPDQVIVIREKESRQTGNGGWLRAYVFADGHVEFHSAPTQDGFTNWEKERMVPSR
jgi:RNA polymerase sigma factor (sigma-70 family)